MSDNFTAVEVLIGRMESNPEEFLYGGRLRYIAEAIHEAALSPKLESERLWFLKDAEKIKLISAYRDFCRARFQDELFTRLFETKTEVLQTNSAPSLGTLMEKQQALLEQALFQKEKMRLDASGNLGVRVSTAVAVGPTYSTWPGSVNGGVK
jgi:hypothetical protein